MAGLQSYGGFSVGDKVSTTAEWEYTGKTHLASFVKDRVYDIIQIGGNNLPDDRVVIGINGVVTAAVKMDTLTNLTNKSTPVVEETPPPVTEPEPVPEMPPPENFSAEDLAAQLLANQQNFNPEYNWRSGGGVMTPESKSGASQTSLDYNYTANGMNGAGSMSAEELAKIERNDPSIIQNRYKFPKVKSFDSAKGYYRYNYYMDYESDGLMAGLHVPYDNAIRKALNIDVMGRGDLISKYAKAYNKFKLLNANDVLAHSFAHVFFVRPDCNILQSSSSLANKVDGYSEFYYALKQAPFLLRELCQTNAGYGHELALYLSNKASSFEISDEYITSGTYGESLTGFKIPYGKTNIESQAAGKFSITYHDDRDLHIYHLHRLWTNYISYVYRGKLYPKDEYILNKVLDYPTCVYYILTAEDGETIIFWSKYWGVFPLEAPSSGFSYNIDNAGGVFNPELKLEYQFAWKEDFNPLSLIEFNTHTRNLPFRYVPPYQPSKVGTGYTWSGPPFIETLNDPNGLDLPYTFKLRFRPE